MELTQTEKLLQESLLNRVQRQALEINKQQPESVPNPIPALTAVFARVLSSNEHDDLISEFITASSIAVIRESQLTAASEQIQHLEQQLEESQRYTSAMTEHKAIDTDITIAGDQEPAMFEEMANEK